MNRRGDKGLISAVDSHRESYRKRLKNCRHEANEDAVHKLRIATRRLLALIELIAALMPQPGLRSLRKALKAQLDGFDELRDVQVMRLEISATITALPELAPFLHHLHISEQRLLMATPIFIQTLHYRQLRRKLQKLNHSLKKRFAGVEIDTLVLSAIDDIYNAALIRYQSVDASQPSTIHRLRIAVKKLRYMLAAAETSIPDLPGDHLQRLQQYLTLMGEIQNSVVLLDNLERYFADNPPLSVREYYRQRHHTLLDAYMSRRAELLQFWRTAADQPLPWQR